MLIQHYNLGLIEVVLTKQDCHILKTIPCKCAIREAIFSNMAKVDIPTNRVIYTMLRCNIYSESHLRLHYVRASCNF